MCCPPPYPLPHKHTHTRTPATDRHLGHPDERQVMLAAAGLLHACLEEEAIRQDAALNAFAEQLLKRDGLPLPGETQPAKIAKAEEGLPSAGAAIASQPAETADEGLISAGAVGVDKAAPQEAEEKLQADAPAPSSSPAPADAKEAETQVCIFSLFLLSYVCAPAQLVESSHRTPLHRRFFILSIVKEFVWTSFSPSVRSH